MIYQNLSRLWLDFTGAIANQTTEFKIDKNPKYKNINLCCLSTSFIGAHSLQKVILLYLYPKRSGE